MEALSPFGWMHIGHWTSAEARTGCTIAVFDGPVVASGEIRGGAPATREFGLLDPVRTVESIDAVMLSGGSAFGLAAADGAVQLLDERGLGFPTAHGNVPIVVGMSLYDLGVGDPTVRPGPAEGRLAAEAAVGLGAAEQSEGAGRSGADLAGGPVDGLGAAEQSEGAGRSGADLAGGPAQKGAGAGATVGKWRGAKFARPGGLGASTVRSGELVVTALVAVNAVGELAGTPEAAEIENAIDAGTFSWPESTPLGENTTIGVIATNAVLTKIECFGVANAGHDGMARAIVPAHTPYDGDALVVIAKPEVEAPIATVRTLAAAAVERAILSTR